MLRRSKIVTAIIAAAAAVTTAHAQLDYERIGVAPLKREQPSLTGAGIPVGQVEPPETADPQPYHFEVNPANATVSQPTSLFTWISGLGTATTFPNSVGVESGHANLVGSVFYGASSLGIAPGVQRVRNYEANYYANPASGPIALKTPLPDVVVNQSWAAGANTLLENNYDEYAATYNVLFVSGMNNAADTPPAPGSCYNGIGVGTLDRDSSVGPTSDGRSKPDIVVSGASYLVSYVTPAVSGSAALLWQAAARNDGGGSTASLATNSSVIKALLLNGAIKPFGWTNGPTRPLDARWGAGNLNVYNSWQQLRGGRASTAGTNANLRGWDSAGLTSIANSVTNRYVFNLATSGGAFVGNATLVWKRTSALTLANFDLYLFGPATNLVASSQSTVDNVEHFFATNLPPGRYELRVVKRASVGPNTDSYALAFDFASTKLQMTRSSTNVVVSWPINEAGLVLQFASSLPAAPGSWQTVTFSPSVTNAMNTVTLPASGSAQYFRLIRP